MFRFQVAERDWARKRDTSGSRTLRISKVLKRIFLKLVRLLENHAHSESFLPSRVIYERRRRSDFGGAAKLLSRRRVDGFHW